MEEIPWQGGEARRYFWNRKTPRLPCSPRESEILPARASASHLSLSLFLSSLEFVEISRRPVSPSIQTHDILPRLFSSERKRKHVLGRYRSAYRITQRTKISGEDRCRFGWRNDGKKYYTNVREKETGRLFLSRV